jgi:hypothetical protein
MKRLVALLTAVAAIALTSVAVAGAHSTQPHAAKPKPAVFHVAKTGKTAWLLGKAEVGKDGRLGAGDPDAVGSADFHIVGNNTVCYGFTLTGADTPTDVHIHRGKPGVNGPVVIEFGNVPKGADGDPDGNPGASSGCKTLTTPTELSALAGIKKNPGNWYANIHTTAFPTGAVRGQLSDFLFNNDR